MNNTTTSNRNLSRQNVFPKNETAEFNKESKIKKIVTEFNDNRDEESFAVLINSNRSNLNIDKKGSFKKNEQDIIERNKKTAIFLNFNKNQIKSKNSGIVGYSNNIKYHLDRIALK